MNQPAPDGGTTIYYTVGGTATNGVDYTALTGNILIPAGSTQSIISVTPKGDTRLEATEQVTLTITETSAYKLGASPSASINILDNNTSLAIASTPIIQPEGSTGTKNFTFTLSRSGVTTGVNTVNWLVSGIGTNPANADDFAGTFPSGTVTFAAGEISQVITVTVQGDISPEANEQFRVSLSHPSNGAILTTTTARGMIQNDDFIGDDNNNSLKGTALNDYLDGKGGNDILNGGAGADSLLGGLGNDTYIVDNVGDIVTETSTLATEIDTVQSSVSYSLGLNLERLTLTGTAAINGTGNTRNNTLRGNGSDNILNGGLGRDVLIGGGGNDQLDLGNETVSDTVNYNSSSTPVCV